MDIKLISLISLRGLALLMNLQGQTNASDALTKLAAGIESGMNVDDHMANVADAFKAGMEANWPDIINRINTEVDEFLSQGDGQR